MIDADDILLWPFRSAGAMAASHPAAQEIRA